MKTVGNDIIRHQLHENRKWYLLLGALLVIFGLVLLASLGMATLTVVTLFGVLMMIGGVLHLLAAFKIFDGSLRWLWALFGLLYIGAGYYAFKSANLLKENNVSVLLKRVHDLPLLEDEDVNLPYKNAKLLVSTILISNLMDRASVDRKDMFRLFSF